MCKKEELEKILDLGFQAPSDEFRREDQLNKTTDLYPLELMYCKNCGLAQLSYVVPPQILYQNEYPYESSTTETGKKHYFDFANSVSKLFGLDSKDLVVDVGSNVGVLLEGFKNNGCRIIGIDPAKNIVEIAEKRGIPTYCAFFGREIAEKVKQIHGEVSVITGTNVFAHVNDLHAFMDAVKILLKEDGVFIFESPNMLDLYNNLGYDSIYHEHLSYLSLKPVKLFCESIDMEVIRVENYDIHQGSFRVFIARKGKKQVDPSVEEFLNKEQGASLHTVETMQNFANRAKKNATEIEYLIKKLKQDGKKIAAVSMPAKGQTLLQFVLSPELISFGTDKSKLKIGRYSPGLHIPVKSDDALLEEMPDYALLLAWNFADEIIKNNEEYRNRGGKFIIPLPEVRIV